MNQQTISRAFSVEGAGIHTGAFARVVVQPAQPGVGRVIRSAGRSFPAHIQYLVDTTRCTTLGIGGCTVSTVEHLLSALAGCGIDNCFIEVDGAEIPILDGSALPFAEEIRRAGIERQDAAARFVRLREPVAVSSGASELRAEPSGGLELEARTDFDEWPNGSATVKAVGEDGILVDYDERIAPARTFAFQREVEMLISAGLARGGSLDNALIISPPDTFSTPLRLPSEWCVHKLLDLIGDLALLNARPAMTITALRPGHRVNALLAQSIFDQNSR